MAKKRRRAADKLNPAQLEYLCRGYTVAARYFGDEPEPFENEDQAREARENHSAEVLEEFKSPTQGRSFPQGKAWAQTEFGQSTGV